MKRFIYTTIALAAVAIGCTKSNIVELPKAQETPISFDVYNGRTPITKASGITTNVLKSYTYAEDESGNPNTPAAFHVKAFKGSDALMERDVWYMPESTSNGKTTPARWYYGTTGYWPASGSLSFVAYGFNADKNLGTTDAPVKTIEWIENSKTQFVYKVPQYPTDQEDLIVALPVKDATASSDNVDLNFRHLLSRVGFKVKTKGEGTASVKILNVILHGTFKSSGLVDLAVGTSTTPPVINPDHESLTSNQKLTVQSYALFNDNTLFFETTANAAGVEVYANSSTSNSNFEGTQSDRYMMIMPGEVGNPVQPSNELSVGDNPYIEVQYQLTGQTGVQKAEIALPDVEIEGEDGEKETTNWIFEAGKAYEFVFEVSISKITFTGDVEDWDETHDDYTPNI